MGRLNAPLPVNISSSKVNANDGSQLLFLLDKLFRVPLHQGAGWKAGSDLNEDAWKAEKEQGATLTSSEFLETRIEVEKILNSSRSMAEKGKGTFELFFSTVYFVDV